VRARAKRDGHRSTRSRPRSGNDVDQPRARSMEARAARLVLAKASAHVAAKKRAQTHPPASAFASAFSSAFVEGLVAVQEGAHHARAALAKLPKRGARIVKRHPAPVALGAALALAAAVAKLLRRR
jgi:hypothetical protein